MKQIINKYDNGSIWSKYYINQFNGLFIDYWNNGSICWKSNYINDKEIGMIIMVNQNKYYITYETNNRKI